MSMARVFKRQINRDPVVGHAKIVCQGIGRALLEFVEVEWLNPSAEMELIEPVTSRNDRRIFRLDEKVARCKNARWLKD